jgi:NADPH2:quinone reductase
MRAAIYERTGPAREVLRVVDLPAPHPSPGEVRVRLVWSGVNPSDVKSRAGLRSKVMPFAQVIPHSDGAGVIDEVGSGVEPRRVGQRVWLWNAAWGRPFGTAADYVVLPAEQAVPLPEATSFEAGACLGIPALTAHHAVSVDGGIEGKSVLIAGGAGAVGHYAIQMARRLGARRIISTVSNPQKAALARSAGADLVLNYKTDDIETHISEATAGQGVDRIIEVDFGMNRELDLKVVKSGGDIVVYGSNALEFSLPFVPLILKNIRMRFFIVYHLSLADRRSLEASLTSMLEKDSLKHNIAARLPIERIVEAHEMVEEGLAVGNVIVDLR